VEVLHFQFLNEERKVCIQKMKKEVWENILQILYNGEFI
jgi:hypothetical protein